MCPSRVDAFVHPVTGSLVEVSVEALAEALMATQQEIARLTRAYEPLRVRLAELREQDDAAPAAATRPVGGLPHGEHPYDYGYDDSQKRSS